MAMLFPSGYQFFKATGRVVASGTVTFYDTTTTTPRAVYSDADMSVSIANPYSLDAGGRLAVNVYGSGLYTVLVKDSTGATVFSRDDVFGWDDGSSEDIRTAAEIAAGVTPTAYQYDPGDVRRYGADPTGVADSTAAIQAAFDSNDKVTIDGSYLCQSDLVVKRSEMLIQGTGTLSMTACKVHVDPFSLASGNFLYGLRWHGVNVVRTGTAGDAMLLDGDYPTTKAVANFSIRDCIIESTGDGLVMNRPLIGELQNVRPQDCTGSCLVIREANVLSLINCRPFNSDQIELDGCVAVNITGGSIEKLQNVAGGVVLNGTNRPCENIEFENIWFEDNEGNDIVVGADGVQANTIRILSNRFRNDTSAIHAIEWVASSLGLAEGNRYTGYTYPHGWDTGDTSVVRNTVRGEVYGTSTIDWINNKSGRISRLDHESALVVNDFATVNADTVTTVDVGALFGTGTGNPDNELDSVHISCINKIQAGVFFDGHVLASGNIAITVYNFTAGNIVLGSKTFRVELFRN